MATKLSLLAGEALSAETGSATVPSLESQPFRSGELPQSVSVELTQLAATRAKEEAGRAGIPTELWIRIAVEATRHVRGLIRETGLDREAIEETLDAREQQSASAVAPIEARRQRAYAQYLRSASPRLSPQRVRRRLSLALPDTIIAAWAIDAAAAAVTVSELVSVCVAEAPRRAVAWEAAAADCGQQLSDWIYQAALVALRPR